MRLGSSDIDSNPNNRVQRTPAAPLTRNVGPNENGEVSTDQSTSQVRPTLFVSYAKEDQEEILSLAHALESSGLYVWLDNKDLLAGDDWREEIEVAIEQADYVLVCFSSNSVGKTGFVQKEMRYALEQAALRPDGKAYILPVRLDECDVPRRFQRIHYVDLFKPDGLSRLVYAV